MRYLSLCLALPALLAGLLLPAGPARAQMTEDQFLEAVMPVLGKVDSTGGHSVLGMWMTPEYWAYQLTQDPEMGVGAVVGQQKVVSELLIFMLGSLDDKPLAGLRTRTARAVLRLSDGTTVPAIRPPALLQRAFARTNGEDLIFVVFPARHKDGRPKLAPSVRRIRLEIPGEGKNQARVFEWALPLALPRAAQQELQRLASSQESRARAFAPPKAMLSQKILPWLLEVRFAEEAILGMTWCPTEWWELTLAPDSVAESTKAGVRLFLNDLTTFMLMGLDGQEYAALKRLAERCVLIDASGARHKPVELPAELQRFHERDAGSSGPSDPKVQLLAFKVKLDTTTREPFRMIIEDGKGGTAVCFRWQPPLAMPPQFAEALAGARRP